MKKIHIFLTLCIVSSAICYICTMSDIIFFITINPSDIRSQIICAVSQWNQKRVDSTEFPARQDCIARTMSASHQNYQGNELYFTFLFSTRLSHDYLNNAGLLDDVYHHLLETIHKAGYLNDTILIFFSDHGMRWGEIMLTSQGYLEERLPFMFIVPPPGFKDKHPLAYRNLYNNRNKLTTPFDIHATLEMILENKYHNDVKSHGERTKKGVSLFSPISFGRTCADADIPGHYCTCQSWTQLNSNSIDVRNIVKGVVTKLNKKTTRHSKKCAQLSLHTVNAAKLSNNKRIVKKQVHRHYRFQLQTKPGFGLFDVSVWVNENYTNWESHGLILLDDAISRINRYDNQSWCVNGLTLKKLCYCAELLN